MIGDGRERPRYQPQRYLLERARGWRMSLVRLRGLVDRILQTGNRYLRQLAGISRETPGSVREQGKKVNRFPLFYENWWKNKKAHFLFLCAFIIVLIIIIILCSSGSSGSSSR